MKSEATAGCWENESHYWAKNTVIWVKNEPARGAAELGYRAWYYKRGANGGGTAILPCRALRCQRSADETVIRRQRPSSRFVPRCSERYGKWVGRAEPCPKTLESISLQKNTDFDSVWTQQQNSVWDSDISHDSPINMLFDTNCFMKTYNFNVCWDFIWKIN